MTPSQFRLIRQVIGHSVASLALYFHVAERSIRRWEAGRSPIPNEIAETMAELDAESNRRAIALSLEGSSHVPEDDYLRGIVSRAYCIATANGKRFRVT